MGGCALTAPVAGRPRLAGLRHPRQQQGTSRRTPYAPSGAAVTTLVAPDMQTVRFITITANDSSPVTRYSAAQPRCAGSARLPPGSRCPPDAWDAGSASRASNRCTPRQPGRTDSQPGPRRTVGAPLPYRLQKTSWREFLDSQADVSACPRKAKDSATSRVTAYCWERAASRNRTKPSHPWRQRATEA
jgi:hypothetical protein